MKLSFVLWFLLQITSYCWYPVAPKLLIRPYRTEKIMLPNVECVHVIEVVWITVSYSKMLQCGDKSCTVLLPAGLNMLCYWNMTPLFRLWRTAGRIYNDKPLLHLAASWRSKELNWTKTWSHLAGKINTYSAINKVWHRW